MMRNLPVGAIRVALVLMAALAARTPACAQDSTMTAAASEIAQALDNAKQHSVIVFDFHEEDYKYTALGQSLADECSNALRNSGGKLRVEDRSRIAETAAREGYSATAVDIPGLDFSLAYALRVSAYVNAKLAVGPSGATVEVRALTIKDRGYKVLANAQFVVARSDEVTALLSKTLMAASPHPYIESFDKTYVAPKCIFCPRADYSSEALNAKVQGTVVLLGVVGEDGRVREIRVLKSLPLGLTDEAIE